MKTTALFLLVLGAAAFTSCGQTPAAKVNDNAVTTGAPVETNAANSDYKPAFAGQTRVGGVKTTTPYEFKVLTEGLSAPWGITSLPDGRLLITEKGNGTLRIAKTSGELSPAITGLPAVNSSGQGGLLGITIDPAFEQNRMLYWVFSESVDGGTHTSVAKGKLSADESKVENATVIYRATPAHKGSLHYGGRILFDKSGNLFVSTGERSDIVTRPQAQQLNSGLGKIVRITKDGKAVTGNPFANQADARPELYSYGHRNV